MKTTTKKLLFVTAYLSIFLPLNAQYGNNIFLRNIKINPNDSNKLFLGIENANVLKNNEYFGKYDNGYTVFGYLFNPRFIYYPTSKTKIEAGIHLLKYSGIKNFTETRPIFTFQYNVSKGFDIVMGSIFGSLNHQLIEPVFKFERFYTYNIEDGVQFLVYTNHYELDAWMSWEKFIFTGDPFQEEFTMAFSSKLIYTKPLARLKIFSPMFFLYAHKGGQIDSSPNPVESLVNMGTGINIDYKVNKYIKSIGWHTHYIRYSDVSFTKLAIFKNGNGLFSQIFVNAKWANIQGGYWYAERFIAPRGEPLFQCISVKDTAFFENSKHMLTGKFILHKEIFRGINLSARFESYYDIEYKQHEYAYGLQITFNHDFFIRKINMTDE